MSGFCYAGAIKCETLECSDSLVVQTTLDINSKSDIKLLAIAGEGILGGGEFHAQNAFANDYFEFNGEVKGNIFELNSGGAFKQLKTESLEKNQDSTTFNIKKELRIEVIANI